MDDNEHVCPLCCEDLDISDQQFFPCKCGYQVCMWCWHRIRESESGLCPACRTPYGDDPHEFSAVDVQEVLKANREKEAAAKRERERQRQQQNSGDIPLNSASSHIITAQGGDGGDGLTGIMEVPKDRTQLANMRVIRRNLVYAVGLPPSIANEDQLRKADYFGQYGKMSKIVLNRNQASNGDPRRASCSAYVTFIHKEDTLACILAVDGFYLENRNIRASYGTSKYCSAFIKNVRCNNPECTYLHDMGAVEDTFTKQEIQAGYVTSGRDVLARQQQIVQQALSASSQGTSGTTPRRKIGGGGPSGTGRAASNPVFPVPEFDEPQKATPTLVPVPSGMSRANSTGSGFPTVAAAAAQQAMKPITRSASVGTTGKSNVGGTIPAASRRETVAHAPPQAATAASVVAGVHSVSGGLSAPSPRTTLTPLTPLKRASKTPKPSATSASDTSSLNMPSIGSNSNFPKPQKANAQRGSSKGKSGGGAPRGNIVAAAAPGTPPSPACLPNAASNSSNSALASLNGADQQKPSSLSSLGGEVIAAPGRSIAPVGAVGAIGSAFGGAPRGNASVGSGALNGLESSGGDILGGRPMGLSGLGGEVFTGSLMSGGPNSAIGGGNDKWGSNQFSGSGALMNSGSSGSGGQPIGPAGGLWASSGGGSNLQGLGGGSGIGVPGMEIGGGVIGSHMPNGGPFGGAPGSHNSGSSALASILGIHLPTGSGSLREATNDLWPPTGGQQHAPVSSLHGAPMPMPSQGVIGRSNGGSSGLIGGVPIGGNPIGMGGGGVNQQGAIGSSNKNDIALLQSLLPEVHITSGNGVAAQNNGWNPAGGQHQQPVGVGAVGRNMSQQAQTQGAPGNMNIW